MPLYLPEPWGKNMPTQWRGEQLKMTAQRGEYIPAGNFSSHTISPFHSEPRDKEDKQAMTKDVSTNQKQPLAVQQAAHQRVALGCIQGDAITPRCRSLSGQTPATSPPCPDILLGKKDVARTVKSPSFIFCFST